MSRPRMFLKGEAIRDPAEAMRAIANREWLIFCNKPVHPGWASAWQVNMVIGACKGGLVFRAVVNPERAAYDLRAMCRRAAQERVAK